MLKLSELVDTLGYRTSNHYRMIDEIIEPETAHLFRVAENASVHSVYLFETSPGSNQQSILPPKPVVYLAEAKTEPEANEIHRKLWNLNYAPFLIVRLPHQIRIYTGFAYSYTSDPDEHEGLLGEIEDEQLSQIVSLLADFSVNSIDSGNIWKSSYGEKLNPDQRVDKHLLKNLQKLGEVLKQDLPSEIAHALIGKYVYIRYLRDREILTDNWLIQNDIAPDDIFTSAATVESLNQLTLALENRFNGKIFPIQFSSAQANGLKDKHVSWVASVFNGGEIYGDASEAILQLPLIFKIYDFHYIPVETLSAIYEQFIENRKEKGAIYTPEFLADYLLSEVEWAKPLIKGGKLLDPACGSGIFLVLAYRRLIEKEIQHLGRDLSP